MTEDRDHWESYPEVTVISVNDGVLDLGAETKTLTGWLVIGAAEVGAGDEIADGIVEAGAGRWHCLVAVLIDVDQFRMAATMHGAGIEVGDATKHRRFVVAPPAAGLAVVHAQRPPPRFWLVNDRMSMAADNSRDVRSL